MMQPTAQRSQTYDRTWLAVVITILGAVPGFFLAGLIVLVYTFFLKQLVDGHWIPYLEEVATLWFPELLRGLIAGAVAIKLAQWRITAADFRVARYASLSFWGCIAFLSIVLHVTSSGITLELIEAGAFLLGFGVGLWADEFA